MLDLKNLFKFVGRFLLRLNKLGLPNDPSAGYLT